MKTTFYSSRLCNIPGVFYPTTVLSVDDDKIAIDAVIAALAGQYNGSCGRTDKKGDFSCVTIFVVIALARFA